MEKQIKITENKDNKMEISIIGFSDFEVLGLLRAFEARVRLNILHDSKPTNKLNKNRL